MSGKADKRRTPVAVRILIWLVAILAVAAVCASAAWFRLVSPRTAEASAVEYKLRVPDGMTVREAARELEQNGIIRSADALYVAARLNLFDRSSRFFLRSGVYTVSSAMPLSRVYEILQSGEQEYISVSIPEGLTMTKIAGILEEKGICGADSFLSCCRDAALLSEYGIPAVTAEGYLFPDTYFLTPDMEADAVARRLLDTFFLRIGSVDGSLSGGELHRVVTLASIVEREYRVASEAPLIASVFSNRLRENIGLYSCATIEYIITEIQGKPHPSRITYADLEIDSPYNTYKWAGLTPGPISNPGLTALSAAAHPADTDYYYFVLNDAAAGTHTFSRTFDAHIAAENAASYVSKQ